MHRYHLTLQHKPCAYRWSLDVEAAFCSQWARQLTLAGLVIWCKQIRSECVCTPLSDELTKLMTGRERRAAGVEAWALPTSYFTDHSLHLTPTAGRHFTVKLHCFVTLSLGGFFFVHQLCCLCREAVHRWLFLLLLPVVAQQGLLDLEELSVFISVSCF